ncbi:hypothetical protein BC628DRAFT_462400 [Trametes gibbosa]|nr:hypothetical protein BC628DRAFT_462400 [Trametes gibbosa]
MGKDGHVRWRLTIHEEFRRRRTFLCLPPSPSDLASTATRPGLLVHPRHPSLLSRTYCQAGVLAHTTWPSSSRFANPSSGLAHATYVSYGPRATFASYVRCSSATSLLRMCHEGCSHSQSLVIFAPRSKYAQVHRFLRPKFRKENIVPAACF